MQLLCKKRWLAGLVALLAVLFVVALAQGETLSGSCGENLVWTLDDDGLLVIWGTGSMTSHPWYLYSSRVRKIVVNDGVTDIVSRAFEKHNNVESVYLPNSLKSIGTWAFFQCTSLKSVSIPDGLSVIEDGAFSECESLTKISLPDTVTAINNQAFSKCASLASFTFPSGVTEISYQVLSGCGSLTRVKLPSHVVSIGWAAFCDCVNLTDIPLPDSLTTIGSNAFENCSSLNSVTFPISLDFVDAYAYVRCGSLSVLNVSSFLSRIGKNAFLDCGALKSVIVPVINPYAAQYFRENGFAAAVSIRKIGLSECRITEKIEDWVYTGKKITPSVSAEYGPLTLAEGTDYTVTYKKNTNIGTASVVLEGKNDYEGKIVIPFKILPQPVELVSVRSEKAKQLTVRWEPGTGGIKGYEIEYSLSKNFKKSKTVRVSGLKTDSKTIKNLKSKNRYFIRIRAWKKVSGKMYYSEWSPIKNAKVK